MTSLFDLRDFHCLSTLPVDALDDFASSILDKRNLNANLIWKTTLPSGASSPILTSLDPATGTILKQARLPDAIDNYYASPVAADDKIFLPSENGKIAVVKPGRDWELLRVNNIDEPCYATPAVGDARLYLRTSKTLYCFGKN